MSSKLVPAHVAEKAKCQLASSLLFSLHFPLSKCYQSLGFLFQTVHIMDNVHSLKNNLLQVRINIHVNIIEREVKNYL